MPFILSVARYAACSSVSHIVECLTKEQAAYALRHHDARTRTAFDIAGKGVANADSMVDAVEYAMKLLEGRRKRSAG